MAKKKAKKKVPKKASKKKVSRRPQRCRNCGQRGHNTRTCTSR